MALSETDRPVPYSDLIVGAAIFDLSGLPKEYFASTDSNDVSWVQTVFQALGLQSLLISSLRLEGFRHVIVHGAKYQAVVVKQKNRYIALLVSQTKASISAPFIQWAQDFEPDKLKANPRFGML
jgi:predicted regulator of Ras-like GTPase activity (Roadblock/LC7/MglB family)